jgi:ATP-binding cassette subfamily B protein
MFKTLKKLSKYSYPYRGTFIVGTMLTILFALLALVDPYISGEIIDSILNNTYQTFIVKGLVLFFGVTLFRTAIRYVYFLMFEKGSQKIIYGLRQDLYQKIQQLDFTYFDKTPVGQIMSKMTGDIEAIRHFYAWVTHVSLFHGFVFIFAIIAMLTINIKLTLSIAVCIPIVLFFSIKLSSSVKPMFVKIREQFSRLNIAVQENIGGNRVIKAFAREPVEIQKFQVENIAFKDRNIEAAKIWERFFPILDGVAVLVNVIVLSVGSYLVIREEMTIGELVTFSRLLWMINNPMRMIGWLINATQNFVASYEKIEELLEAESQLKINEVPVKKEIIAGYIQFEQVSFYFEDMPVLRDISFEVKPGQTVAIIGATGSGKSTLTHLISRFYDADEGKIFIDHLPIGEYDLIQLRANISVAMQDIFLFSDTIENNISYGVQNSSSSQVKYAAEIAGVNEFIHKFDQGFDTVVGERGVGLSGGQKQRIALARALMKDPSILILDDTTSAVDMETEYKILSELKKVNAKRTTLIIAHRISSVKDADLILVMEHGQIIERGTHDELLEKQGYYYNVFLHQMGEFDYEGKEVM